MRSKAATVQQYLDELPPDRRAAIQAVREVILRNLDGGYEEGMQYGMIGYYVPHHVYPPGYHCDPRQPLPFAALASQKNYLSFYAMSLYALGPEERWFRAAWAKTGRKLDMGKCCVRFKRIEDAALEVIGESIRRVPVSSCIAHYESALRTMSRKSTASRVRRKAVPKRTSSGSGNKSVKSRTSRSRRTTKPM